MQAPLVIIGGRPLRGEVEVRPAKNAALPIIAATLLTDQPVVLDEAPRLKDIEVLLELLGHLGTQYAWEGSRLHLFTPRILHTEAPYELMSKMRASFIVLGALVARAGEGRVSMPGGCAFGPRPVDLHVKALRALGAEVGEEEGAFWARTAKPLAGRVVFDIPTVTGTEHMMIAAALGETDVTLINAAQEPEVEDLGRFLSVLGADVQGLGTSMIRVRGARRLGGARYRIIPDRIEAGTYLLAAAATRGDVTVRNVRPEYLDALLTKLSESGHRIDQGIDWVRLVACEHPVPFNVEAREYPGFPTDLQPPVTAYLATVEDVSLVTDRVYPDRFTHVGELARMGAQMTLKDRVLAVRGGRLHGAVVKAFDIRAGASLLIAALAAEGESTLEGMNHVVRGYQRIDLQFERLGARMGALAPVMAQAAD